MSRSRILRPLGQVLPGSAAAVLLCSFGLASPAKASAVTLCPSAAGVGGFGETKALVAGPLDGTCGANSAVEISIPASTDYGKLTFGSGTSGYPPGLTLGGLSGLSSDVLFTSGGSEQPYYLLAFTDSSVSLGQASAADQILMIEFQSSALSGSTLAADPNLTRFNLYDNSTGNYLGTGQSDTNTLNGWLGKYSALGSESLQGIWVGEGLTGGDSGAETLTVNSLTVDYKPVPEPASVAIFCTGLIGLGAARRRNRKPAF
jgi:PEP-CTERM motif